jgi:anti-sigma B factor antagonist
MEEHPDAFTVDVAERDGRLVVRPEGELDLATAPELEQVVMPALQDGRPVLLDLRGLEFLDSSGVRSIVEAHAAAGEGGTSFAVVHPGADSPVWRVLEISGVDRALAVEDPS